MDGTYFEIAYWHTSVTWGSMPKYTIRHRVEYGMVACWLGLCIWDIHSEWRWHSAGWAWFGLCQWELCFSDAFIGRPCFWLCCWHHWRFQRREQLVRLWNFTWVSSNLAVVGSSELLRQPSKVSSQWCKPDFEIELLHFCCGLFISCLARSTCWCVNIICVFGVPFSFCDRLEADYSAAGRRNCYHV